ncbi:Fe-S cluster assembly ATPase SufC [Parasphaerochaeta coccoides]|uniref:Iron-regulated ABC transporter ATPase subunit SufC n=1 Tax=Parasphaerochaeta coccoides (strain ATCC BAA-1237 / DSM 17374 / SPN1) TaxID=760011 RepID=F4GLD0_PARC1|nr:Fe-S cluster assembly ATPase SufC [Parasphaerochaeta coccoides]AEC02962.1 Iron-regulated ABC transporter ATPase subunit SufC [Parasphaerochaeta coccoides DSM 17374]
MSKELLKITDVSVKVEDKELLSHIDLTIKEGELHVLMGPNGAGKSTLGNVIMGHPSFTVEDGTIFFDGEDITEMDTDKRAKLGLFLSFQNPEEVPGINMENFIRTAKSALRGEEENVFIFNVELRKKMSELDMDPSYARRYLNVGFSGGEKKKAEILQMLTLEPKLAILDETDSGLDVDAVRVVSQGIEKFRTDKNALLVITHNTRILEHMRPDFVHVLVKGRLVTTGDASLIKQINEQGYTIFIGKQE